MNPKRPDRRPRVLCFATQGPDSGDARRIAELLAPLDPEIWRFDRDSKAGSCWRLLRELLARPPELVVMEGTGVAGGMALIAARVLRRVPFVVSSGDAVGPYVGLAHPLLSPIAWLYEYLLCRLSSGYIGWSPYLAGRALTFGAPRAMTAANWSAPAGDAEREARREELGIPNDAIVFGIVGSLEWNPSVGYCYGHELVRAVREVSRADIYVVVVGDGSGRERLVELAGEDLGRRVLLPGRVPRELVAEYLSALDVASLPQSVDGVGSFRYTIKISEYLGSGLPVVTGQIPLAYDLDDGWLWRLPGEAPWDPRYVEALAELMRSISREDVDARRERVPRSHPLFDFERQQRQVSAFVRDLVETD